MAHDGETRRGATRRASDVVSAGKLERAEDTQGHVANQALRSWRAVLAVHPAANLFPLMPPDELIELGQDIAANGLQVPITIWSNGPADYADFRRFLKGKSEIEFF